MIDYDPHNWQRNLWDVRGSMVKEIILRVAVCALWAAAVFYFDGHFRHVTMPATLHTLVGTALGLLLVFRTNASYDRFWEGRKLWGGIVNETRNLARSSKVLIDHHDPELHRRIVRLAIAWTFAVMNNLRGRKSLGPAEELLDAEEAAEVLSAPHVPLALSVRISGCLHDARERGFLSDIQQMTIDSNVQQLVDYMGACERIRKTPLPFAYVVHLRRALVLYCFTLPFALVKDFHAYAIVATFVVAYTFFGIEEIGVEIEDPFGEDDNDLPLNNICETIRANLTSLVEPLPRSSMVPKVTARM